MQYGICYTNGWSWRQWTDPHGIKFPDGSLSSSMPSGYKVTKRAKNGLIHLNYYCCIQQHSFKRIMSIVVEWIPAHLYLIHIIIVECLNNCTILRNKLIEWPFIWLQNRGGKQRKRNEQIAQMYNYFEKFLSSVA